MAIDILNLQERIADSDPGALKELYDHFVSQLLELAFTIIRSKEMAEEIVEDTFIKIWERRAKIRGIENLQWYLYVVTRNISLNYLHKIYGKAHLDLEEISLPYCQVAPSPEDLMISGEMTKKINFAINDLPPKCRLIFKLVKEDGLKYKEVAALLDISIKTVENQMGIALKKLHQSIKIYFPELKDNY